MWCWRRLLRVPWTARRSNQSILKEITPGISLEGMMLKLKLQYFGHLMWRVDSLEKTLMLGGIGDRRGRGRPRMRWLDGITDRWTWVWVNSGRWWWTGWPGVLWFLGSQRVGHDWATELNWTCQLKTVSNNRTRITRIQKLQFYHLNKFLQGFFQLWYSKTLRIFYQNNRVALQNQIDIFALKWISAFQQILNSEQKCTFTHKPEFVSVI